MTSRDRVLMALAHEEPDRVPMDFSANVATLERLMRDLQVATHRDLLDRLHVDMVDLRGVVNPVYRGPGLEVTHRSDGITENYWGWRTRPVETATGPEECYCEFALATAGSLADLERHPWPQPDWFDFSGFAERLEPWKDFAIMASGASVFQHPSFLRGMENLLADMASAPELYAYLSDRFTEFYYAYFERMFLAAPGRIDILRIADDLAMQDRLLFSPAVFDRCVAPRLSRLIELAHRHGAKVMFHSCGAVEPLLGHLIDLGVDAIDPVQVRAKGMDPAVLKQRYGEWIVFHGSIDTQYTLPRSTPSEVAAEVRKMIDVLGCHGGFVLAPSHVLQTDVTTENILALYATGYDDHSPSEWVPA